MNFFKASEGPGCAKLFKSGKQKEWRDWVEERRKVYDAMHVTLDDGTTAEAKVNISKQKLDLRKQQIEQARVTMQTKMREEVGRRRYTAVS